MPSCKTKILVCVILLALCWSKFAILLKYFVVIEVMSDLKRLDKGNKKIQDTAEDLKNQVMEMSEKNVELRVIDR